MKTGLCVAMALAFAAGTMAEPTDEELRVRATVDTFYADVNDGDFRRPDRYSTLDWTHVDANGERTRGRDAVLAELRRAIATRPKGETVASEETSVRFATTDVALVSAIDRCGKERQIRTFVLVKQKGRWRITLDQATNVGFDSSQRFDR